MPQIHEGFAPLQPPNTNPFKQRRLRRLLEDFELQGGGNEGEEKGMKGLARAGTRWPSGARYTQPLADGPDLCVLEPSGRTCRGDPRGRPHCAFPAFSSPAT